MSARSMRIELRVSTEEKRRMTEAARRLGLDLSSFIRTTALREAERLEREHRSLVLSVEDRHALLEALDTNSKPTEALISIFRS